MEHDSNFNKDQKTIRADKKKEESQTLGWIGFLFEAALDSVMFPNSWQLL